MSVIIYIEGGGDNDHNLERSTDKGYAKGKVSFELLAQIDPALVGAACPHAKAFLNRLRMLCL